MTKAFRDLMFPSPSRAAAWFPPKLGKPGTPKPVANFQPNHRRDWA
jgi:hypothetical protein